MSWCTWCLEKCAIIFKGCSLVPNIHTVKGVGGDHFRKFLLAAFHVLKFWHIGCLVTDMTVVGAYMPHHLHSYCFTVVGHLSVSFDSGGQVIGCLLPIKSPGNLSLSELSAWTLSPVSRQLDSGCIMNNFVMSWCFVLRNYVLSWNSSLDRWSSSLLTSKW